jgi:acetyl-CoA carboxylase carboxyltransferase component
LYVRQRIELLLDGDSFVEDGRYANSVAPDLPADGVVTGRGTVDGRPVLVVANDPTVKAGSWGARTVEKIVRVTEAALREELPVFWLVDSAGARITDQVDLFPRPPWRRPDLQEPGGAVGAGTADLLPVRAVGGGWRVHPRLLRRRHHGRGQRLDVPRQPRMAQMVVGETVSLEEMGGARMHCTVSGCGDLLAVDDADAIEQARVLFGYLPGSWRAQPPSYETHAPQRVLDDTVVPEVESQPFDVHEVIDRLLDDDSFFEIKPLFAAEIVVGFGRLDGETVGVLANNSAVKGGVLFSDSADKSARFIWLCDAYNVPLLYLADVPGFMIGSEVERGGIIRHGAKMITAVSEATVPQVSVVLRKAYGAGLYAMAGPGFGPDAALALPTARIAVMGPEAAVNAVYAAKIEAITDEAERAAFVADRRREYEQDVDLERLVSDLVLDGVVEPADLRDELVRRFRYAAGRDRTFTERRHGVPPV